MQCNPNTPFTTTVVARVFGAHLLMLAASLELREACCGLSLPGETMQSEGNASSNGGYGTTYTSTAALNTTSGYGIL